MDGLRIKKTTEMTRQLVNNTPRNTPTPRHKYSRPLAPGIESAQSSDFEQSEPSKDSISKDSITMTHSMTVTMTNAVGAAAVTSKVFTGNPKNWHWETVKEWLTSKGLEEMHQVFVVGSTSQAGTSGDELLRVTMQKLKSDGDYPVTDLKGLTQSAENLEQLPVIEKFFRELTKLQIQANQEISANSQDRDATVDDVLEIRRRLNLFIEKWDRILWIEGYVENNGQEPTEDVISEELGIALNVAKVYLHYFETKERTQEHDVNELLLDFNVYNDCVIWWFVIVLILTNTQTESIWLIFNKVAELTPGNVAIELLDRYKRKLTRYPENRLEEMAQNVMIGSQYPICAGLRLSKWFMDIAEYDVAREKIFQAISESFIDAAFDYLDLIKSDHLATIVLEVRSDIDEMNAIEMGLEYELSKFVTNQRIERITTSVMNDFEFLRPVNKGEAFEIDPLSVKLVWRKLFYPQFYFTPVGTYVSEIFLYLAYLALFTYLSVQQFRVYSPMTTGEMIFWIFNIGYVLNELQSVITSGLSQYYSDIANYFDTVISLLFLASLGIRTYALSGPGPACTDAPDIDLATEVECWHQGVLNTIFIVLWGTVTITLWLRIINFMILSHSLGPMVAMIFRMMGDIATFFTIMLVLFLAFAMCLMFTLGDVLAEYSNPGSAAVSLFLGLLGNVDFDALAEADISTGVFYFAYGVQMLYLVIGSLVLLNLLIAMMAKTFDTIEEDTTASIIFARYKLALDRDTSPCFIPPPLNVPCMLLMALFYLIEGTANLVKRAVHCCRHGVKLCNCKKIHASDDNDPKENDPKETDLNEFIPFDFAVALMPKFMKARKLELDEQILFKNCEQYFSITTNKGLTKCKFVSYTPAISAHYVKFYKDVSKDEAERDRTQLLTDDKPEIPAHYVEFDEAKSDGTQIVTDNKNKKKLKGVKLMKVSLMNSVDKKHQWSVDLLELHKEGLVDLKQFDEQPVDARYTHEAHKPRSSDYHKSPYWICGYCRGYVKASQTSLNRLGYDLNVIDIEMKIVKKMSPEICPNCYRVRLARKRWELVWEIFSIRMFYYLIWPCLFLLVGFASGFKSLRAKLKSILKSDAAEQEEEDKVYERKSREDFGDDAKKYMSAHYQDTQLIATLNEMDIGGDGQFNKDVPDRLWEMLTTAKDDIDMFLLLEKINSHVMSLSFEDELTMHEFFDCYIDSSKLRKDGGDVLWTTYFEPLATTIFKRAHDVRDEFVPLPIFGRYPFDFQLLMDDISEHFSGEENSNKQLSELTVEDIVQVMNELKPLRCADDDKRQNLINKIDVAWQADGDNKFFDKFCRYMREVQRLFQDPRTIKNMLRDVESSIVERGACSSVFLDQIHFLFEDIRNVELATPFFNAMRTEKLKNGSGEKKAMRTEELKSGSGEKKVELWTIRNTLFCLYFVSKVVREVILHKNPKVYVNKEEILDLIYTQFEHEIIDPDGITDLIQTEVGPLSLQKTKSDASDADDFDDQVSVAESAVGPVHKPPQYLAAQKSAVSLIDQSSDDQDDLGKRAKLNKMAEQRMELFHNGTITAFEVEREITAIFKNIRDSREHRLTESTIDFYRRNLREVRLLQDDEALRFVFEQLSRYATFYPSRMEDECTFELLKKILCEIIDFGEDHNIDKEMVPKLVLKRKPAGDGHGEYYVHVQQLYDYLKSIYVQSSIIMENPTQAASGAVPPEDQAANKVFMDDHTHMGTTKYKRGFREHMSLEDVLSIIMLYERMFVTVNTKIIEDGDMFVVTDAVFCKFVDGEGFDSEKNRDEWTHKSRGASDLFQAVLDEQQNFVTLGQVRQTVEKLMDDISAMKCGELTRIMNHLHRKSKKDTQRCKDDRQKMKEQSPQGDCFNYRNQLTMRGARVDIGDGRDAVSDDDQERNPALKFKHISRKKWVLFLHKIAQGFDMNVQSKKVSAVIHAQDLDDMPARLDEKEEEKSGVDSQSTKKIIDSILENTNFDIQRRKHSKQRPFSEEDIGDEKNGNNKETVDKKSKKRADVFDSVLSFCSGRITLQQLFRFSKQFGKYLCRKENKDVHEIMEKYGKYNSAIRPASSIDDIIQPENEENNQAEEMIQRRKHSKKRLFSEEDIGDEKKGNNKETVDNKSNSQAEQMIHKEVMKRIRIPREFEKFKEKYFPAAAATGVSTKGLAAAAATGASTKKVGAGSADYASVQQQEPEKEQQDPTNEESSDREQWDAAIHWLLDGCDNEWDLCHKIDPFWSASIIEDLSTFMESTEQIQGDYELKLAEFGQLKHSLHVNDELAVKLFHIIRFKERTLTWGQIYHYLVFLLKMKYNIKTAILSSEQAQDTTVSMDGMKLMLKIQLNDESKWLFNKVDAIHGSKVTWKQVRKYLEKVISVRANMRDFFEDNAKAREFEDKKAELINTIHDNAEVQREKISRQLEELTASISSTDIKRTARKPAGSDDPRQGKDARVRMGAMAKSGSYLDVPATSVFRQESENVTQDRKMNRALDIALSFGASAFDADSENEETIDHSFVE